MTVPETSPAPGEQAGGIPLSLNQEFVCLFDQGESGGPFGPRYHLVHGWRVRGGIDDETLRGALDDVVARHEALRTRIATQDGTRHQEVLPPCSAELVVKDLSGTDPALREEVVETLLNDVEAGTIDSRSLPHLRAVLGRFDDQDAILVIIAHHTATDGWSMRLIIRDLAHRYAARRDGTFPDLPATRQYREYARWQLAGSAGATAAVDHEYWRRKLRGAEIFTVRTDRPRSAAAVQETSVHRFLVDAEVISGTTALAKAVRGTPFMVLFAAFSLLEHRRTGRTDITVPTFTPGRGRERDGFGDMVGSCFNFLPLRTDLAGCRTFREIVERTRTTCLEGYSHDIPTLRIFEQAPELMRPAVEPDRAPWVFQVFPFPFVLDGEVIGDLEYTEVRMRLLEQPIGSDVPDGALWTLNLHPTGELVGSVQYKSGLYDRSTIGDMVSEYRRVLGEAVAAPDAPLRLS
ncbi:condensation domain-containing protein [Streptosporangium sp. NPDC051023]|uniref:condensation domain-containing protein n=1 Tax=Streptosporangium sp. NPDC051023 TaxID=3155410 RepID=UPI00345062EB